MRKPNIPWGQERREFFEGFKYHLKKGAVRAYAGKIVAQGFAAESDLVVLKTELERAALYYYFGRTVTPQLREQSSTKPDDPTIEMLSEWVELARLPKNRPRDWGMFGFIWVMAEIWEALGHHAGTAEGEMPERKKYESYKSHFQVFCENWLKEIEPDRKQMPRRMTYRNALEKREKALKQN